jgi:hypothetical protein
LLDGKSSDLSEKDVARRNSITKLLSEWELIKIDEDNFDELEFAPIQEIKILSFKEKSEWELVPKYNIGKKI